MGRNKHFDQIKGILILLVIIGHVLLGTLEQNILRSFIYFFHMPLFLAISGYYISLQTLKLSIRSMLYKYWYRMLLPFTIALIVYSLALRQNPFSGYPYYHLWYIPAVMLFIFYLRILYKIRSISFLYYPLILLFISITIFFETYSQWGLSENWVYNALGDKRFYYFFSYFALGHLLANTKKPFSIKTTTILMVVLITCNQIAIEQLQGLTKVLINFTLIYLVILYAESKIKKDIIIETLVNVGRISLPIYLWHVIPILLLKSLILSKAIYYGCSLFSFIIFIIILLRLENKHTWINRLFYGK